MVHFQDSENGWRRVVQKPGGKGVAGSWDVAAGGRKMDLDAVVTSFFITEFGDNWKANELFYKLKELGEMNEVVIPPKRDMRGRRYMFARFFNMVNEKLMAVKLDNVVLEGRKLFANLPRFQ